MNKPNILFIITDDQRRDTIHSLGNTDIITPNLDSLVKEGTSFTNTYIAGGYTGAICMPSRAMINTGKYLTSLVNNGADISNENTILGEYF
jgi:arylsulfatase A-like enzyme